jgi:CheY-like chemotaxis protein
VSALPDDSSAERPALRFLIVEDDPTNRVLLRAVLGRAPDAGIREATVVEVATLHDARRALAAERPDVVFLDVRLPDGSGLDLAGDVLTKGQDARPRLLVMSASVLQTERAAVLASGCDAFLAKPYRPQELLEVLAQLLP